MHRQGRIDFVAPGGADLHLCLSEKLRSCFERNLLAFAHTAAQGSLAQGNRASAVQHAVVEKAAQAVLDARKKFPDATLADLYDPLAMPPALVKAHAKLDRAVDRLYRPQLFQNNHQRVEHLFALYEKLTAPLIPTPKKRRRKTHSN